MHLQLHDQTCLQGGEFLGRSAWMRFRLHLSSLSPGFEIAFDGGPGDSKQLDDIFTPISLIDGTKNTFSQIGRIGFHRFAPLYACLLLVFFLSFYHWLRNSANRCKQNTRRLRCILILDCCFSGAALTPFSAPEVQVAFRQTLTSLEEKTIGRGIPNKGISLLCSSNKDDPSLINEEAGFTAFTQALLHALYIGN